MIRHSYGIGLPVWASLACSSLRPLRDGRLATGYYGPIRLPVWLRGVLPVVEHPYPSVIRAFTIPIVVRLFRIYPPHWLQRRKQSRGGSFLVMLRPARWLERLASPRPRLCAADRPARLQQSLPQPGSPPDRVCYHYSAQPSIAEAGLAPASMSKVEGCTSSGAEARPV